MRFLFGAPVRIHANPQTVDINVRDKTTNKTDKIQLLDHIASTCPSLVGESAKFYPTPWLLNGHLQTAYAAYKNFDDVHKIVYERTLVTTPDGGQFTLDWTPPTSQKPFDDTPIVVVLHGLTGGSHESYIRSLLESLTNPPHNYRAVVFNARGCAESKITTPQMYCAAYTEDLRIALKQIQNRAPDAKIFAIGFSLGSNILVKYLGEESDKTPIIGAISIANPFDLVGGNMSLERRFLGKTVYSPAMAENLKKVFLKHQEVLKLDNRIRSEHVLAAKTVREFDDRLTRLIFRYDTVNDYYRDASSCRFITKVRIPLLCLTAEDDPISTCEVIPYDECRFNPYVILATTSHGGHLGWFTGFWKPVRWCINPLVEFCVAIIEADRACLNEERQTSSDKNDNPVETVVSNDKIPSNGEDGL
ncbi:1534_t:CDS:2 [Paraglomus brasilianum]|uniref:1534_t:CDS:1 n=1 Tax=Paraglomus brasilianum TaxID=144538 RepID=A0A9N8ZC75_9GLOM|nr:1534_t:CDS:2 [Paraglomus brasilianum]